MKAAPMWMLQGMLVLFMMTSVVAAERMQQAFDELEHKPGRPPASGVTKPGTTPPGSSGSPSRPVAGAAKDASLSRTAVTQPDGSPRDVTLVVVGDGAVGKTSMLISFTTNAFPGEYIPTSVDEYFANLRVDGQPVKLRLRDTHGQSDYDRLRPASYTGVDVVLIVFSIVSRPSFDNVQTKWVPEIRRFLPEAPILLVGSKSDLRSDASMLRLLNAKGQPMVSRAEGERLARESGAVAYREVSALTREGLTELFDEAVRTVLRRAPAPIQKPDTTPMTTPSQSHLNGTIPPRTEKPVRPVPSPLSGATPPSVPMPSERQGSIADGLLGAWKLEVPLAGRLGGVGIIAQLRFSRGRSAPHFDVAQTALKRLNITPALVGQMEIQSALTGETLKYPFFLAATPGVYRLYYYTSDAGGGKPGFHWLDLVLVLGTEPGADLLFTGGRASGQPMDAYERDSSLEGR